MILHAAADFQIMTDFALKHFEDRVACTRPGMCFEFDIEVARLESQVEQLYGLAALLARRETELDATAEIWGAVIAACDSVAAKILSLCAEHPACSASYDNVLDIRNKATRLRDLHS